MGYGRKYTDEQRRFILDNYKGIPTKELAARFNARFNTNVTPSAMKSYKGTHKLLSGCPYRFKKGHVPANKGKKMPPEVYEKVKTTMFKKGQIPANHRPVGSERINVDGYIEVKVREPNAWELKHRIVWEQVNGKVPDGYVVIMLDENKQNCELSNLKLIKRSELLAMNRYRLFQNSAELNDVASNIARVIDTRSRAIKARRENAKSE